MSLGPDILLAVCLGYVAFLFLVAALTDRAARRGGARWVSSPVVYTLSISVYCTSWTFYGAVGSAARNGLEFVTIYLGPMLVFVGWWWVLRKLVRIGRTQRITSIADLISSRYGKSPGLAVLVTVIAAMGVTPYIALQLKAVTQSFAVVGGESFASEPATAFWVALGMAAFTILFGTRNVDANARHHGVVAAIALEALVKLVALLAVAGFAVWGVSGGLRASLEGLTPELLRTEDAFGARWMVITLLSAAAILCLPRQFQVTVVEAADERHLAVASWAFPLYLLAITIGVLPIAAAGLAGLPAGSEPDMFVLTLPLAHAREELALLAFLGGFSSATSMVIVASIALSTMVSNHIVTPIALRAAGDGPSSGDVRQLLLVSRRISIVAIVALGFVYYTAAQTSEALFSIGLVAFAGVAQFLPPLIGGLYWRQATGLGAIVGLAAGATIWVWTLVLPAIGPPLMTASALAEGPFGIAALRPEALLGLTGMDPLVHAVFWSLSANVAGLCIVSLLREPRPIEWLQSALFVDAFRTSGDDADRFVQRSAAAEDLFILAQRILGVEPARRLFAEAAREQGLDGGLPVTTDRFIGRLERELAGSVGAASAHAMVGQAAGGETISMGELMRMADETAQLVEYAAELEKKRRELEVTAAQLRIANARLRELDARKDDFLSHVSHELRTPMTAVRSFTEILLETDDLAGADARRFLTIIHDESLRLTRLLNQILELNVLERGEVALPVAEVDAMDALRRAVETSRAVARESGVVLEADALPAQAMVKADIDRLAQVFINLLGNAVKYNDAETPRVRVTAALEDGRLRVRVADNGPGVAERDRDRIFLKFSRGWDRTDLGGAGLGLAISRQIMRRFGGDLALLRTPPGRGAVFEAVLPLMDARARPAGLMEALPRPAAE